MNARDIGLPPFESLSSRGPYGPWRESVSPPEIDYRQLKSREEEMSGPTREEIFALLAKSEAQTRAMLEGMRAENAEFRSDMRFSIFQVGESISNETRAVAEQVSNLRHSYANDFTRMEHAVESRVSSLKIWVLGGALAGVMALFGGVVADKFKDQSAAPLTSPPVVIQQAPYPYPPAPAKVPGDQAVPGPALPDPKVPGPTRKPIQEVPAKAPPG